MAYSADAHGAAVSTTTDALADLFDNTDRWLLPAALTAAPGTPALVGGDMPVYADLAARTLLKTVADDHQPQAADLPTAVAELIRQMKLQGETVMRCTCTAAATALADTAGDGAIVLTTVRGDGTGLENCVPETARVACVTDSYTLTATAGAEGMRWYGELANIGGVWSYSWPGGSAVQSDFFVVDANAGPTTDGNILSNSGFEAFTTTDTPDDWTIEVGTASTHVFEENTVVFAGDASLEILGSAVLVCLTQTFADDGGVVPLPLTAYAVNLWVQVDSVPAAGVLTIDLYDPTAADVVADAAGTDNTFSIDLTALDADAWTNANGVFRLPKAVPAGLQIRIRLSTALSVGTRLYVDHLAMAPVSVPYDGGPGIAVFGGSVPFAAGDGWQTTITNDRGNQPLNSTMQALFDRLFQMRVMGLQLPSSLTPSIADTLIVPAVVPWLLDFSEPVDSMYLGIVA